MTPAWPTPLSSPRSAAMRLACLPLLLSLVMAGLLAGCSRPEPAAPTVIAAASGQPAQPASSLVQAPAASPVVAVAVTAASASAPQAVVADAASSAAAPAASRPAASLPPAIIAFQKQRDACDHFRGEEPYDKQRAAFLKAQLAKTCKGSDKALAALRQRFAKQADALAALKDYEDRIE